MRGPSNWQVIRLRASKVAENQGEKVPKKPRGFQHATTKHGSSLEKMLVKQNKIYVYYLITREYQGNFCRTET